MKTIKELTAGKTDKVDSSKRSKSSQIEFNPPINAEQSGLHEEILQSAYDIEDLKYMFEGDLSDLEEHEHLLEDLTMQQRQRKRMAMRRNMVRIRQARRRAMQRRANTKRVMNRARRMAISRMKRKFANGRNPSALSVAEKNRVERMVRRRRLAVNRAARRNVRAIRTLERQRLNNSFEIEVNDINMLYEVFFQVKDLIDEVQ